jgi:hypothetical protein
MIGTTFAYCSIRRIPEQADRAPPSTGKELRMSIRTAIPSLAAAAFVLASPAHATLQLNAVISGSPLVCADGDACDIDPAVGQLALATTTVNGVQITGSFHRAVSGAPDILSSNSTSVINNSGAPRTIAVAVSDTEFTGPVDVEALSGSGTWLTTPGSTINLAWFLDPANAQGATSPTDGPGALLGTFTNTSTGVTSSFNTTQAAAVVADTPFSMTELFAFNLNAAPGSALTSRGQTLVASPSAVPVPEPTTLLLLGAGLLGIGLVRRRKRA